MPESFTKEEYQDVVRRLQEVFATPVSLPLAITALAATLAGALAQTTNGQPKEEIVSNACDHLINTYLAICEVGKYDKCSLH